MLKHIIPYDIYSCTTWLITRTAAFRRNEWNNFLLLLLVEYNFISDLASANTCCYFKHLIKESSILKNIVEENKIHFCTNSIVIFSAILHRRKLTHVHKNIGVLIEIFFYYYTWDCYTSPFRIIFVLVGNRIFYFCKANVKNTISEKVKKEVNGNQETHTVKVSTSWKSWQVEASLWVCDYDSDNWHSLVSFCTACLDGYKSRWSLFLSAALTSIYILHSIIFSFSFLWLKA